jgi:hypothetical protein
MKKILALLFLILTLPAQAQIIDVTTAGLKADWNGAWFDGVNSGTAFSSASSSFTAADIGKIVSVVTPGVGGATYISSIATIVSPTAVTLSVPLGINASGLMFYTGTDNTAALNALLVSGANLYFPKGNYGFAGIVRILPNHNSIKLFGDGPNISNLFYINGGAVSFPFIDIQSAQYTTIKDLTLWSVGNDWGGWHITVRNSGAGDPSQTKIDRVGFSMAPWSGGLLLDTSLETFVDNSRFSGGFTAIQGASAGSYSNIVNISRTQFSGQMNVPIRAGGDTWTLQSDTFEARLDGKGAAFQGLSNVPISNLTIIGCWFGDARVGGRDWVTVYGAALNFIGNTTSAAVATDHAVNLNGMANYNIPVGSNTYAGFTTAVAP